MLSHKSLDLLLPLFWHFNMYTVCITNAPCGSISKMNLWTIQISGAGTPLFKAYLYMILYTWCNVYVLFYLLVFRVHATLLSSVNDSMQGSGNSWLALIVAIPYAQAYSQLFIKDLEYVGLKYSTFMITECQKNEIIVINTMYVTTSCVQTTKPYI